MILATYHGGSFDDSTHDYTELLEWHKAIKSDFRKFIEYKLKDMKNSKDLINELTNGINNLDNFCPYGKDELVNYNIERNNLYTIIEYPVYCSNTGRYEKNRIILSNDYCEFIFVNNIDSIQNVSIYTVTDDVLCENMPFKVNLDWNLDTIGDNKNYLKGYTESKSLLGNFKEDTKGDINGINYNYNLALLYMDAMVDEDFLKIGNLSYVKLREISRWLQTPINYNFESDNFFKTVTRGNFMTKYNRTFADAVALRGLNDIAFELLLAGSINPRIYLNIVLSDESGFYDCLNFVVESSIGIDEYNNFVIGLLKEIDNLYNSLDIYGKLKLVDKLKPYLLEIQTRKSLKNLSELLSYEWLKDIFDTRVSKVRKLD
jgi:hypothetical protein